MTTHKPAGEFSRPVEIDKISKNGSIEQIEADATELEALARRMKLPAIHALKARLEVRPWKKGRIRVKGEFDADIEQECVRTLDIFRSHVHEPVERLYMKPTAAAARDIATSDRLDLDLLAEDAPDIIAGDVIDIGELVAESLALALDPWPKKPGTTFMDYETDIEPEQQEKKEKPSPFAVLETLRKDRDRH